MSQSTEVMQAMQQLVKMPEVARTMQEMSKEMMKAGIMEEMMEDTFEGLEDQDELEEAAQEEVDKVRHVFLLASDLCQGSTKVRDPGFAESKV